MARLRTGAVAHDRGTVSPVSVPDSKVHSPTQRRPWLAPTLTRHESLTALTQVQDPQEMYPPGMSPYPPGFGPYADQVPCSQGFCH